MDASTVFFNMINEYCGPLLNEAGYRISAQGFIEDENGNKLFYQNPKYVEGTQDPQNPPFIYPMVPIDERSYLNIKATPDYELFNPFQNYKHACIVLYKLKNVLIPCYVPKEKLDEIDDDRWDAEFGEYFQIYTKKDNTGMHEVGIVDLQDPAEPKELMKYSSDNVTKSVWGLAVMIYNNFCATKKLKQFANIDRGWNKTQKLCDEWNKARLNFMQQVKIEQENVLNPDMVDYTNGMDEKAIEILPFSVNKFIDVNDCTDKNDSVLQQFLTDMFPKSQLTPYEEPIPDDESPETVVTEEFTVPDTLSMPEEVYNPPVDEETVIEPTQQPELVVESKPAQAEVSDNRSGTIGKSIFSFNKPTNNGMMNPMMGGMNMNPMMGMGMMNPMMGGMGMMGMNPMMGSRLPGSNIDDMNLCSTHVDPFANYR